MIRRTGWAAGALACAMAAGCGEVGDGSISVIQFRVLERAAVCRNSVLCQGYPNQAACMASIASETHASDTLVADASQCDPTSLTCTLQAPARGACS